MGFNTATHTFDTFQDLRYHVGESSSSVTVLGKSQPDDGFGGTFYWDNESVNPDNDETCIISLNTLSGRWIKITDKFQFINGTKTFITNGGNNITVLHPWPDNYNVFITPKNTDSMNWFLLDKSAGNFTISYPTTPAIGTVINFDWTLTRQF